MNLEKLNKSIKLHTSINKLNEILKRFDDPVSVITIKVDHFDLGVEEFNIPRPLLNDFKVLLIDWNIKLNKEFSDL